MHTTPNLPTADVLSRYIDRFLFAEGWRVTDVVVRDEGASFDVTLTKESGDNQGRSVTRTATSAGEATFKACSSARNLHVLAGEE
jgi:hypothetical protein